jgi:hypothetical protein
MKHLAQELKINPVQNPLARALPTEIAICAGCSVPVTAVRTNLQKGAHTHLR